MPDFSSWSPQANGGRLAEADSMAKLAGMAKIRHETALADEAEMRASEGRRLTQAMAKLQTADAGKAGSSLADQLEEQALQLSDLGFPAKAGALGVQAANIRLHEAQQLHQEGAAGKLQFEEKAKTLDRIANLYGSATNERDWAAANMMVAQQFPEFDNPLAKVPYSPEAARMASAQALSMKDRLGLKIKAATAASEDSLRKAREGYLTTRADLLERQTADRERRTEILEKTGGKRGVDKPVGSPTSGDIKGAASLLKSAYPDLPKEDVSAAAYQIAGEARRMAKENPGLSMSVAMTRAFAAAQKDGYFETTDKMFGLGKSVRYSTAGRTPEAAIPAPADRKFQAGRYYQTPKGVMKFDGTSWHPAQSRGPTSAAVMAQDVPDEEDE